MSTREASGARGFLLHSLFVVNRQGEGPFVELGFAGLRDTIIHFLHFGSKPENRRAIKQPRGAENIGFLFRGGNIRKLRLKKEKHESHQRL